MSWAENTLRDLRHALRMLAGMRMLSVVVVLSLAVGVGVNTVVFSWVQAVVFKPLPGVADSGGLHFVEPRADTGAYPGVSWLEHHDMRERLHAFRDLVAFRSAPLNVGDGGRPERTFAQLVSGNFFGALGLRPESTRGFEAEVRPFWRAPRGPQEMMARALLMLQGVMLLLLLAVCGNTANLMLARATTRYREIGVRLALGAGRSRVVSLLLTENLVLAVLGAACGAAIAVWGTHALRAAPFAEWWRFRGAYAMAFSVLAAAVGLISLAAAIVRSPRLAAL